MRRLTQLLLLACVCLTFMSTGALAQIRSFNEDFDYEGFGDRWNTDFPSEQFAEDGLRFSLLPGFEHSESIGFETAFLGVGSFESSVTVLDLSLGRGICHFGCDGAVPDEQTSLMLAHMPAPVTNSGHLLAIFLTNSDQTSGDEWLFRVSVSNKTIAKQPVAGLFDERVTMGIRFDAISSTFTANYEGKGGRIELGPFDLSLPFDPEHVVFTEAHASTTRLVSGVFDQLSVFPFSTVVGDFDGDGEIGLLDVTELARQIQSPNNERRFDVTSDGLVDADDLRKWVNDLKGTYLGDADLDGQFGSSDLINVFRSGEYEDDVVGHSTWATGDWNADGEFSTRDLVMAFQDGGYEKGPREAVVSVPEPSGAFALLISALAVARRAFARCGCNRCSELSSHSNAC